MTSIQHPGIDMVEKIRSKGDFDDQEILSRLRSDKAALNVSMERTKIDNPAKLDSDNITLLRKLEVGIAYLKVNSTEDVKGIDNLRAAIRGELPALEGQPSDSARYAAQKEHATAKPKDYGTVKFDF